MEGGKEISTVSSCGHESVTHSFKTSDFRKKRQENTISVRKQRREEQHLSRRMRMMENFSQPSSVVPSVPPAVPIEVQKEQPVVTTAPAPAPAPASASASASASAPSSSCEFCDIGQGTQHLAEMQVPGADSLTDRDSLMAALTSDDTVRQLQATNKLRQILSNGLLLELSHGYDILFFIYVFVVLYRYKTTNCRCHCNELFALLG